jgi:hypothetical protein
MPYSGGTSDNAKCHACHDSNPATPSRHVHSITASPVIVNSMSQKSYAESWHARQARNLAFSVVILTFQMKMPQRNLPYCRPETRKLSAAFVHDGHQPRLAPARTAACTRTNCMRKVDSISKQTSRILGQRGQEGKGCCTPANRD